MQKKYLSLLNVISSEPRSGDREIPVLSLTKIPLLNKPYPEAARSAH
jgi:hypothetical protein